MASSSGSINNNRDNFESKVVESKQKSHFKCNICLLRKNTPPALLGCVCKTKICSECITSDRSRYNIDRDLYRCAICNKQVVVVLNGLDIDRIARSAAIIVQKSMLGKERLRGEVLSDPAIQNRVSAMAAMATDSPGPIINLMEQNVELIRDNGNLRADNRNLMNRLQMSIDALEHTTRVLEINHLVVQGVSARDSRFLNRNFLRSPALFTAGCVLLGAFLSLGYQAAKEHIDAAAQSLLTQAKYGFATADTDTLIATTGIIAILIISAFHYL